ncbi:MAG TPA: recombinase family protein [Polyangia bacterium]|nr:recombinase family protein [Polyangia bacterium]
MGRAATQPTVIETWAYCRYSSAKQNDYSIEQQQEACAALSRRNGLPVPSPARVYADRARSAKSLRGREALAQLLRDAAVATPGVRRVLLVWSVDRLGRNLFDAIGVAGQLHRELGFRILSEDERLDSEDEDFRSELARAAEHADRFLMKLRRNTVRGLKDAAARGAYLGKPPIGFKRENKKLVIDPGMMRWVAYAFEQTRKLRGHVAEVMRRLREQPTGRPWPHKRVVTKLLRNERYVTAGVVSREVFDDVQRFMTERGQLFNRTSDGRLRGGAGKGSSVVLGLFKCADCGGPITVVRRDKTDRRLGCRRHNGEGDCSMSVTVRESVLLQRLLDEINQRVLDPEALDDITARVNAHAQAARASQAADLQSLDDQIADREQRAARLVRALETGEDMPEVATRLRELRAEAAAIKERRASVAAPPEVTILSSAVAAYMPRLAELLAGGGAETAAALRDLVRDGVMGRQGRGCAVFTFKFAPFDSLVSMSAAGPRRSSRATPSPASSCWRSTSWAAW